MFLLPKALFYKKYTTSSDVWSYGMVVFEIWSLGEKPFRDIEAMNVSLFIYVIILLYVL